MIKPTPRRAGIPGRNEDEMQVSKMTEKTITLDGEPGERYELDRDGWCINSITLRWAGNADLKARLIAAIREHNRVRKAEDEIDDAAYDAAVHNLALLIDLCLDTLPRYRVRWVWVGHSF